MLQNDSYNDKKKQEQAAKKHSTAQNKGSHTKKMILGPETPKYQNNDKKSKG